jgi:hypothetical protein
MLDPAIADQRLFEGKGAHRQAERRLGLGNP